MVWELFTWKISFFAIISGWGVVLRSKNRKDIQDEGQRQQRNPESLGCILYRLSEELQGPSLPDPPLQHRPPPNPSARFSEVSKRGILGAVGRQPPPANPFSKPLRFGPDFRSESGPGRGGSEGVGSSGVFWNPVVYFHSAAVQEQTLQ